MKATILFLLGIPIISLAGTSLSFDDNLLKANGISSQKVNDALYDPILYQGKSQVAYSINHHYITDGAIYKKDDGVIGIEEKVVKQFELKKLAIINTFTIEKEKYLILDKSIHFNFSRSDNSMQMHVPYQLMLNPAHIRENHGGIGSFINYDSFFSQYNGSGLKTSNINVNYEMGINANNTLIRSHGNYSSFQNNSSYYQQNSIQDLYFDRDFAFGNLKGGRLISPDSGFGVGYLDGAVYSSRALSGSMGFINFSYDTDDYSVAEFYQNNQKIYTTNLHKGHTDLKNIPVISMTTDITVLLKRNQQTIDSQIISRSQITRLNSEQGGYYAFLGRTINNQKALTAGVGFNKMVSPLFNPAFSLLVQKKYQGLAINNTVSKDQFNFNSYTLFTKNEKKQLGINMTHTLSYANTQASFSAMSQDFSYPGQAEQNSIQNQKINYGISQQLNFNQSNSINLNYNHYDFYHQPSYDIFSINYATRIKRASLNLGLSYQPAISNNTGKTHSLGMNINFSLPFNLGQKNVTYYSQFNRYQNQNRFNNSLSASINEFYSINAGSNKLWGKNKSDEYYINNNFITPYVSGSLGLNRINTSQANIINSSLSGAIAANKEGIIFSPEHIKETYAVVNTHIKGFVNVNSRQSSALTNHDGKAIITSLTERHEDFIKINPEGLDEGTIIENNKREFISQRGSVSFFDFKVHSNKNRLFKWQNPPAFVTQASLFYNQQGHLLASFIDKNILLINENDINELTQSGMITPDNINIHCKLPPHLEKKNETIINVNFICTR